MALFFSRRTYNATKKAFTNNAAEKTRYVTMSDTTPRRGSNLSQADWLDLVRAEGGNTEILIYVHGFNTSQNDMLDRMAKIKAGVKAQGFNGAVIAYDWPSNGSVLAYGSDRRDAKKTAPYLVQDGILPLLGLSPKPRIHLIAHSMGAYAVLRAFSDFGDAAGAFSGRWGVDQVTFVSGDVDSAWLEKGAWGSLVLKHRSKRFTNYFSGQDRVLAVGEEFVNAGSPRAGQVGMPELTAPEHWDIYSDAQFRKDVPKSKQNEQVLSHRWWFDSSGFYKDLTRTLAGDDAESMPTRKPTDKRRLALDA